MNIQNIIWYQRLLRIMYDILSLTNSTFLIADITLLCIKKPVPNSWFSFPTPQKNVYSLVGSVPLPSHLTSCTPINYILTVLLILSIVNLACTNFLHSRCQFHIHVLSLRSFIERRRQKLRLRWIFTTILLLQCEVVNNMPKPKLEDHPCWLSMAAYSMHLQLFSPCGGDFLHLQT
jgi:hypothetical protein